MRKNLAASVLVSAVLTSGYARAFVDDASDVRQQSNLRPPLSQMLRDASTLRGGQEESVRFLGKLALPQDRQLRGSLTDQVVAYFQRSLGAGEGLELKALEAPKDR